MAFTSRRWHSRYGDGITLRLRLCVPTSPFFRHRPEGDVLDVRAVTSVSGHTDVRSDIVGGRGGGSGGSRGALCKGAVEGRACPYGSNRSRPTRTCSGRLSSGVGSALGASGAGARASACEPPGRLIAGARQGAPGYGATAPRCRWRGSPGSRRRRPPATCRPAPKPATARPRR